MMPVDAPEGFNLTRWDDYMLDLQNSSVLGELLALKDLYGGQFFEAWGPQTVPSYENQVHCDDVDECLDANGGCGFPHYTKARPFPPPAPAAARVSPLLALCG
jgi:hypothetical protein